MGVATKTFNFGQVVPVFPDEAREIALQVGVSQSIVAGTVVGEFTPTTNVQTITVAGSSGTFKVSITVGANTYTTAALAYNVSTADMQTALRALPAIGSGNVTVTGSAGSSYVCTFAGTKVYTRMPAMSVAAASGTPTVSIVNTTPGIGPGTIGAYDTGHSDGTETATAIARYDYYTDAYGNITLGQIATGNEHGGFAQSASVFVEGTFNSDDLTGLDSGAVTDLGAKFITGNITDGGLLRLA